MGPYSKYIAESVGMTLFFLAGIGICSFVGWIPGEVGAPLAGLVLGGMSLRAIGDLLFRRDEILLDSLREIVNKDIDDFENLISQQVKAEKLHSGDSPTKRAYFELLKVVGGHRGMAVAEVRTQIEAGSKTFVDAIQLAIQKLRAS